MAKWTVGVFFLAYLGAMPLLLPRVARRLLGAGGFDKVLLLDLFLTAYGLGALLLLGLWVRAMQERRLWPLGWVHPRPLLGLGAAIFAGVLVLLVPFVLLRAGGRGAARRFAESQGLQFAQDAAAWASSFSDKPWPLRDRIDLGGGAFIATALTEHTSTDQRSAMTYRTVAVAPAARCPAEGLVTNQNKFLRFQRRDEEDVRVGGGSFFAPRASAAAWSRLLAEASSRAPSLVPEILFAGCDGRQVVVAMAPVLQSGEQLSELRDVLRILSSPDGRSGGP